MTTQYWLMKTEPSTFSIHDFLTKPDQTDCWEGIRNYQARNFMRDTMNINDKVFIYHSVTKPIGIAGTATVISKPYPDHTQFDSNSQYYDPKSSKDNPRWMMVDIKLESIFSNIIHLQDLKEYTELSDMLLLQKGQRLSIQPVSEFEWKFINSLQQHGDLQ